jgi:hypothetical protein
MEIIEPVMRRVNPDAQVYMNMGELMEEQRRLNQPIEDVQIAFDARPGYDSTKFTSPTADEVAVVFTARADGEIPEHSITVMKRGARNFERLSWLSPKVEPWIYPLMFPHGSFGWSLGIKRVNVPTYSTNPRDSVTRADYFCYRIAIRECEYNPMLMLRKLTQQFFVDSAARNEAEKLGFIYRNQKKLKADSYKNLNQALQTRAGANNATVGKVVILPSSFIGGPRNMQQDFQDAMAIVLNTGPSHLFITSQ